MANASYAGKKFPKKDLKQFRMHVCVLNVRKKMNKRKNRKEKFVLMKNWNETGGRFFCLTPKGETEEPSPCLTLYIFPKALVEYNLES